MRPGLQIILQDIKSLVRGRGNFFSLVLRNLETKNPPTLAGGKNERKKMKGEITYAISTNT
ncbi:MAG: hypothetical protein IK033_08755, partial [Verrucomicrobia bacterium]|nr:hypothetical protein [Verrucomicrobiota bacterium]